MRPSSEAEMIAEFLRQEYASHNRYGAVLDECLAQEGVSASQLTQPDLRDPGANAERRRVFARYRGYGTGGSSYLTGFPDTGVAWNWVALTPDELLESTYNGYPGSPWMDLSLNTRDPRVAAKLITSGYAIPDCDPGVFFNLASKLRSGLTVPPPILVSADDGQTRVILEGHTRLTAYALAPETIPSDIHVILGISPAIANWDEY